MSNTTSIIIRSIPTSRGQYNPSSTYFDGNLVTYYGSQFSAKTNNFSNIPPLAVNKNGTLSIANEAYWEVVTNNVELYNATLSENSLSTRIENVENSINRISTTADKAAKAANAATDSINTLTDKVDQNLSSINTINDDVAKNKMAIASNEKAIKALQMGASPLTFECGLQNGLNFSFEDQQNTFQAIVPFKILDGTNDITADSNTSALITYPDGNVINLSGKLTKLDFDVEIPGKYNISVKSTNEGRTANADFDIHIKAPIKMATVIGEEEGIKSIAYIDEFPINFEFSTPAAFNGILRFYVPKYLLLSPSLSCNGISVPTTSREMNIYWKLDYVGGIKEGTYNFTINK